MYNAVVNINIYIIYYLIINIPGCVFESSFKDGHMKSYKFTVNGEKCRKERSAGCLKFTEKKQ